MVEQEDLNTQIQSGAEIKGPEIVQPIADRAELREPNHKNPEEVARYLRAEQGPVMVKTIVGSPDELEKDEKGMKRWMSDMKYRGSVTLKTITATTEADLETEGKAEGWLRIDQHTPIRGLPLSQEQKRYGRITGTPLPQGSLDPCEITYVPRPGGPPDLMASALLKGCMLVEERDNQKGVRRDKNGGLKPRRTIMVFEDPEEEESAESRDALAKVGFNPQSGLVKYGRNDKKADVVMYVLDWDTFDQIKKISEQASRLKKEVKNPNPRPDTFTKLNTVTLPKEIRDAKNVITANMRGSNPQK